MVRVKKYCFAPDCKSIVVSKGLCDKHYKRMRLHGNVMTTLRRPIGSGNITSHGYFRVSVKGKRTLEHISIVENILKRPLRGDEQVHHFNENRIDNRNDNLVVCPNGEYHQLLHRRQRAFAACGDANKRRCTFCKQYDFIFNLNIHGHGFVHKQCLREYCRRRYKINRSLELANQ